MGCRGKKEVVEGGGVEVGNLWKRRVTTTVRRRTIRKATAAVPFVARGSQAVIRGGDRSEKARNTDATSSGGQQTPAGPGRRRVQVVTTPGPAPGRPPKYQRAQKRSANLFSARIILQGGHTIASLAYYLSLLVTQCSGSPLLQCYATTPVLHPTPVRLHPTGKIPLYPTIHPALHGIPAV